MPSGSVRYPGASIQYLSFWRQIILLIAVFVLMAAPGDSAQAVPMITSLQHQRIVGGDSFRLVADGPIPKPFIESENKKLKIDFKGLDCRLPKESKGHFATAVNGKLADRLEVEVEGTPRQTHLALRLTNGADYSYYYLKHTPADIELLIIAPEEATVQPAEETAEPQPEEEAASPPHPVETPEPAPPVEVAEPVGPPEVPPTPPAAPPPPAPVAPAPKVEPEEIPSVAAGNSYRIIKVEYFPLDEIGDRFMFTFDGATEEPEFELLSFPLRFEMTFASSEVKLPVKDKVGPFLTGVPGRGIDKLKAWNRSAGEFGSVFELNFVPDASPKWEITQVAANKVQVDITYDRLPAPTGNVITVPPEAPSEEPSAGVETNLPNGIKVGKQLKEVLESQLVTLGETGYELDWPQDAGLLIEELKQLTAGLGPGVVVDIPLKLRLHLELTGEEAPYPKMEP